MGKILRFDYRSVLHINFSCKDFLYNGREELSILTWLRLYFWHLRHSLHRGIWTYAKVKDVLVLTGSLNNQRTMDPIMDKVQTDCYTYCKKAGEILPVGPVLWYSLPWIPAFLWLYWKANAEERQMIRRSGWEFLIAPGRYKAAKRFYKKNPNIKLVMFANDHVSFYRCFIEQAAACGVKTLYTQHASVSNRFPPLSFSYSFLDGKETLEKYQECGAVAGEVILSGSSRFDVMMSLKKEEGDTIGIAFNTLDDIDKVIETCRQLKAEGYSHIVVRPHPADRRIKEIALFEQEGVQISDSTTENPFAFLSRIGFLVAGDSSIHLEAALMNTPSVLYNWANGEILDNYNYHARGVMPYAETPGALLDAIKQRYMPSAELIRYYVASFGTPYHGKTSELIAGFVDAVVENRQDEYLRTHLKRNEEGIYTLY